MNGSFSFLIILITAISCNSIQITQKSQAAETSAPGPQLQTQPIELDRNTASIVDAEIPVEAVTWDADLYLVNFTPPQEEKVRKAVTIIKKVIASKEFREKVLNYSYKGVTGFVDNGGLSNEEIYKKILEGAEQMGNRNKNNTMDVELELYHQTTKTIGYTYPNTVRIWMNKKYFNRYTPIKVADNLMHEWMHKLGFTHATTWSTDRDHTVPYAIGYLIEDIAANYQ